MPGLGAGTGKVTPGKHEVGIVSTCTAILQHRPRHPLLERTHVVRHSHCRTQECQYNASDHRLVDWVLVGHLLTRPKYSVEPVTDHLRLVAADRLDESAPTLCYVDDPRTEQHGVTQCSIRTDSAPGCHGMNCVADQRDIGGRPGIQRHRGLDVDWEAGAWIGEPEQSAQVRVPVRGHLCDQPSKIITATIHYVGREFVRSS